MTGTDLPQTAAALRSRAAHVRGLMMQLTSQADQDRLREYADELDAKAAQWERGDDTRDPT
jgi:diaminopimelate decarboxylase